MSKRQFDMVAIVLTSAIWLPILLITIVLVFLLEGRPVFYRSARRVSRHVNLRIYKFRTMVRNAEALCNRETVQVVDQRFLNIPPSSPLYTPLGRWIERLQITELPQILHVLTGHMSIVGNRPLPENVIASLLEAYPRAEDRFRTCAGLTGLVQLIGRQKLSDGDRLALESHYCEAVDEDYSAQLDLRILVFTVLIVLRLMKPFTVPEAHALVRRFSPGAASTPAEEMQPTASTLVEQESP